MYICRLIESTKTLYFIKNKANCCFYFSVRKYTFNFLQFLLIFSKNNMYPFRSIILLDNNYVK